MSKTTKEYNQKMAVRKTIQGLKKHIEWLKGQKDLYITKGKEAKIKGISSSYSIARSGLRATLMQLKKSEEMLLNIELISQYKDFAKLSNIFVKSIENVSKELSKEVGKMNFGKAQNYFVKAMMAENVSNDKLENFMENTKDAFSVAGGVDYELDKEIDALIGNEVNLDETDIDRRLDGLFAKDNIPVKREAVSITQGNSEHASDFNRVRDETKIFQEDKSRFNSGKGNDGRIGADESEKSKAVNFNFEVRTNNKFPPIELLKDYEIENTERERNIATLNEDAETIERTLGEFGIEACVLRSVAGPSFSRHEVSLKGGQKISEVAKLESELTMSLYKSVSFELPIIGKDRVGINVRNEFVELIGLRKFVEMQSNNYNINIPLGMNVEGDVIFSDLAKMPHLLVGGCTGSGKSIFLNSLIVNLLYRYSPSELKLLLIDTKRVEFSLYNGLDMLLTPKVIDNQEDAVNCFSELINIMEARYNTFLNCKVRNINEFNALQGSLNSKKMPFIVAIIDEFADLVMFKDESKNLKKFIITLAQKSRACGIHLVIATQRPSVDVIDGIIKANIPSHIAFKTSNAIDSRIIINEAGAASLFGKGDMLVLDTSETGILRLQSPYISIEEVSGVVDYLKRN